MSAARLRVKPGGQRFTDAVFADLMKIQRAGDGHKLFRRLREAGVVITIEKPDPALNPPNAWAKYCRLACGSNEVTLAYDPAEWPCPALPHAPRSDAVLLGLLGEAVSLLCSK